MFKKLAAYAAAFSIIAVIIGFNSVTVKAEEFYQTISAGENHSLAIKKDGTLYAWGYNASGQLGDGSISDSSTPVPVLEHVISVSAGGNFSLAIQDDNSLWAWGENLNGQLGDGTTSGKASPVKVMDNVIFASAGREHSLVITADKNLYCFGSNQFGQLGDGSLTDRHLPRLLMDNVIYAAAGLDNSVVLKSDGTVWAFGKIADVTVGNNIFQQTIPKKIIDNAVSLSTGGKGVTILKQDGTLWSVGETNKLVMDDAAKVSGIGYHTLVLRTDQSLWGYGDNDSGQLSNYTSTDSYPQEILEDMVGITDISAGVNHSLAIQDGILYAWGKNNYGQLGTDSASASPIKKPKKILTDMMTTSVPRYAPVEKKIKLVIDEREIFAETKPIIENGRTLVPLRVVAENLGFKTTWSESSKTITLQNENTNIVFTINKMTAYINGRIYNLDVPPKIVNGSTMVPIRFIAEGLNLNIEFINDTVFIKK